MADVQLSYNFNEKIRDLSTAYQQLIVAQPTIINLISVGAAPTSTKTEWLEDTLSETSYTITALGGTEPQTSFTFASNAGLKVGDIVKFYKSDGANRAGLAKITEVNNNGTQITISRDYASMTLANLSVGDKMYINNRPRPENSEAQTSSNRQQTTNYNYTEIIDDAYNLSNTALAIGVYGNPNSLSYQEEQKMLQLMWRHQRQILSGGRVERSDSEAGTAGGYEFFTQSGLAETTGGAVSSTHLNNALEKIYNASGIISNNLALAMNTNQARRISAFNTSGSNPIVQIADSQRSTGRYVSTFIGDLPVNNGFTAPIVVDPTLPKDQIWIIDLNAIEIAYLRPMGIYDATTPGKDGKTYRMLMETTLRMRNATKLNCKITGLTI